jgi:hypothetical protein
MIRRRVNASDEDTPMISLAYELSYEDVRSCSLADDKDLLT